MPVWLDPGRPTSRSISSSGMSDEMRADPVKEKVRWVGSQKVRASDVSTSERGRVMTRLSRSNRDDGPAARSRSSGMAMVSSTEMPGISTSAKPTELREPTGTLGSATATPLTVMRIVVKVRVGKFTTCPVGVREAGPSGTVTGCFPSKVRVTEVIERSGSPVCGWTRVTELSVRGSSSTTCHHCPSCCVKESVSQAVCMLASRAAEGRSSGR